MSILNPHMMSMNLGLGISNRNRLIGTNLLATFLVKDGMVDSIGLSTILYQSGDASTWQTTAVWGFGYDATTAAIDTALGGNKLFLGTAPIYRTWAEWMDQPWMNLTFLFMGIKGIAAYGTDQSVAGTVSKITRYLSYVDVDPEEVPTALALLWNASDTLTSRTGPQASFLSAGAIPDGNGGVLAANVPAVHTIDGRKLMWNGPAYTNLFAAGPTAPEVKTLTAQNYCLQVFGTGASCVAGSYGSATLGDPLVFTALAGDVTFSPTDCTTWMLTAIGGYIFPYIPPGISAASCAGTTGLNGLTWPMAGSAAADKLKNTFKGEPDGVELVNGHVGGHINILSTESALESSAGTLTTNWIPVTSLTRYVLTSTTANRCRVQFKTSGDIITYSTANSVDGDAAYPRIITTASDTAFFRVYYSSSSSPALSVQKLQPAVCTVASLVRMGAGSVELASTYLNVCSPTSTVTNGSYFNNTNIIQATDGTVVASIVDTWGRYEYHLKIIQVNTAGTQFRVGNRSYSSAMVPIDPAIVWGAWVAYDGSFNPLDILIAALNTTVPHWTAQAQVWNTEASEADILKWQRKYYQEAVA